MASAALTTENDAEVSPMFPPVFLMAGVVFAKALDTRIISTFSALDSSFRGALLREPGIHNPDALRSIPLCGYGFRARGQEPAPRNDGPDGSYLNQEPTT